MASPSQKTHRAKLGILLSVVLITVVLLTAFFINSNFYKPTQETSTDKPYKLNLQHFANTIAVDNGKFFVLDDYANLMCFDAYNGKLLWQANVGTWLSGGILIKNGVIFAGTAFGAVQAVDEATGKLLTRYDGLRTTMQKGPPKEYSVADGRIFITHDGCNAYNIAGGQMLWSSNPVSSSNPEGMPYSSSVWAFEGKLVIAAGGYPTGHSWFNGFYRINPDKGTPQWSFEGYAYQTPLIYENQVILSNYGTDDSVDLCDNVIALTISSGVKVWSYDVGAPIFKPVIVGDRLLFVAQDEYIYALNLLDGSLAWKTALTGKLSSQTGVSAVTVDVENKEICWAYNSPGKNTTTYEGTLYRLNLTTGQDLTKTVFEGSGEGSVYSKDNPSIGLALLNNSVVLTINRDLWLLNRTDLTPVKTEHFGHTLCKPIAAYGQVYVAADLYAIMYKDIE